ncbi:hypothetical protein [Bacillus velezensis]|uniref:hypothetical protein n=1 Tax=Bacillus velezensis TaxID=492670 RepID=UPI0020C84F6B|nr:hypothetical protein [Bacillus velezensis]MCP9020189.1 hypothetical protein [Bacillus velezensis]
MAETKKYVRIKKASIEGAWYADKLGQIFEVYYENSVALGAVCYGYYSVLREDGELIITEKRPAKVGERVLITGAYAYTGCPYKNGDINNVKTADEYGHILVEEHSVSLLRREYEVIVNNEVENEEADGMENVNQTAIDSASTVFEKVGEDYIGSKSRFGDILIGSPYSEAFVKAYANERKDVLVIPQTIEYTAFLHNEEMKKVAKSEQEAIKDRAQARRDEIVEQAKADVEGLREHGFYHTGIDSSKGNETYQVKVYYVEFIVDSKERKVTALVRRLNDKTPRHVGRAQAAPNDCFNVHIGKAIALRRALGLTVPDEYLNTPQPTEVRVGDVVRGKYEEQIKEIEDGKFRYISGYYDFIDSADLTIIDDSREEAEQSE